MPARQLIPACTILLLSLSTLAQTPKRFDIVIDEIFADPSPVIGLPASEFIELKNLSKHAINLRGFKLSDGSTSAIITDFVLQPDSFVVVCPNTAVTDYKRFGSTIGVGNFPSLNNDADVISLYASNGTLLHSVAYNAAWYQNAVKSNGGFTLEMIDPTNPCTGSDNWQASIDKAGGTPGNINSVNASHADAQPPALIRTYTLDSITVVAVFNEPLDSISAANPLNYAPNVATASPVMPACSEVILKLSAPLTTIHQLTTQNLTDCSGNRIGQFNTALAGLPKTPEANDIVINEVLFNPPPDGADYIELYNRSNNSIDLKQLVLNNQTIIISTSWLLFPGQYIAITTNKPWVQQHYLVKEASSILECASLPSMPDDKGDIIVQNQQGTIIDALHYEEKWHFALIDNKEGIALERINYNHPTQERSNWSSAASTMRYGTPGQPNSQLQPATQTQGALAINPVVFSPNNDGLNDYTMIQLQLPEPGYVANIFIFDAQGHRIRQLVQQATLTVNNQFRWDGLDENNSRLPTGNYVMLAELFHVNGTIKKYKNVVTLLRN